MSTEAHEPVSPTWDALRKLGEQCPHPLKVEGECLIVLDSDRRRFTDLGTPEMAQFVLASVNYVRSILSHPAALSASAPTGEGEARSFFDRRPHFDASDAEPSIRMVLERYYRFVFSHEEAKALTDRYIAALAYPPQGGEPDGEQPEIIQHVKSKGLYEVVSRDAQVQTDAPLSDYAFVCVYRNAITGMTWVRPVSEMDDGRFVTVRPTAPTSPSKSSREEGTGTGKSLTGPIPGRPSDTYEAKANRDAEHDAATAAAYYYRDYP